ncbi:MAG: septation ring formation regulator EzrA [Erysipelothrix sp.]|nr:septation ring formation regulator EzrA [Erysipelothrix sp.]
MDFLNELFGRKETQYILVAIIVVIVLLFVFRSVRKRVLLKQLAATEVNINSMRSTPLQYKINKAVGLMKVNQTFEEQVATIQSNFAELTNAYDRITYLLGTTEDELISGHLGAGKENLNELRALYDNTQSEVSRLSEELDRLLEDETRLRDNITNLKNDYRDIKISYQQKIAQYGDAAEEIETVMSDIDQQFNTFEEWMFASEYVKAQAETDKITEAMSNLSHAVKVIPTQLEKAKGIIPHMIDEVSKGYQKINSKGVFLQHLEVSKNLQLISDDLKESLSNIRQLNLEHVEERLEESSKRLNQLAVAIEKEDKAFDVVIGLSASAFTQLDQIKGEVKTLDEQLPELSERFGFTTLNETLVEMKEKVSSLHEDKEKIQRKLSEEHIPSTSLQIELNEFNQASNHLESMVQEANKKVFSARSDEQRAQKQLLKLHLIMNDIATKIDSRHLPHIGQTYDADVVKARSMIDQIDSILGDNPLQIEALNASVNGSIDFIYRLYNNVNNLVGTVDMVENAIVYANKYRSTYPEVDSELTRAEVSFRNGEYTYALKTVIYAIEKIKPGSPYEQLIMDNSRSA